MRIESEDKQRAAALEIELDERGDYLVSVEIVSPEVRAAIGSVSVLADEMNRFRAALTQLEAKKQGEATLDSASPGSLRLRLSAIDPAGHIELEIGVKSLRWEGSRSVFTVASTAFAIDPNTLQTLVRGF